MCCQFGMLNWFNIDMSITVEPEYGSWRPYL